MELGVVLNNMLRYALILLLLIFPLADSVAADQVVLVVNAASPVVDLEPTELRKLFLGWPVFNAGTQLRAIRNETDLQLDQVFYQQVVAMSESAYDHRILTNVLKQGRPRPLQLHTRNEVLAALYADPQAVSYMWRQDVVDNPRIRILRVIW
jgi:hypothetical protein